MGGDWSPCGEKGDLLRRSSQDRGPKRKFSPLFGKRVPRPTLICFLFGNPLGVTHQPRKRKVGLGCHGRRRPQRRIWDVLLCIKEETFSIANENFVSTQEPLNSFFFPALPFGTKKVQPPQMSIKCWGSIPSRPIPSSRVNSKLLQQNPVTAHPNSNMLIIKEGVVVLLLTLAVSSINGSVGFILFYCRLT